MLDQRREGKIWVTDLRHYLEQAVVGSTAQFFALRASGDPLISFSPGTAMPLLGARMRYLVEMPSQGLPSYGQKLVTA